MTETEAYHYIFSLSHGREWVRIPDEICKILGFRRGLGISGMVISTRNPVNGMNEFVDRINNKMEALAQLAGA